MKEDKTFMEHINVSKIVEYEDNIFTAEIKTAVFLIRK
jgi:hypothetical protein